MTHSKNAGEVGDGPDQGHSGGADSVPPAPKFTVPAGEFRELAGNDGVNIDVLAQRSPTTTRYLLVIRIVTACTAG